VKTEQETTEEKKPAVEQKPVEQKSENFIEAAWRWFKALGGPTVFLLTMLSWAAIYFAIVDWRVRLLVKIPNS
jgi:hypothetical protein